MSSYSDLSQLGDAITDVSKFLDIESTVHLSRTCSAFHRSLTDDPLGYYPKLKVPYFDLSDPSVWRDAEGGRIHGLTPDSQSVKTLATQMLPRMHFPSSKLISFRPPNPRLFTNDQVDIRDAFTHLAIGLQSAHELEEFTIDAGIIMRHEKFNQKMMFEVFSKNLANCKKLKRIRIFNQANDDNDGGVTYYSLGILLALIPTMKRGINTLTEVTIMIGNESIYEPPTNLYADDVVRELFIAILSLQKLEEFNLSVDLRTSPLMNEFLKAAEYAHETMTTLPSSETMKRLSIGCVLYKTPQGVPNPHIPAPVPVGPFCALLRNATNLESLLIRTPPGCWDGSIPRVRDALYNKPRLQHLGILFHGYTPKSRQCLEWFLDYIRQKKDDPQNKVVISGINFKGTPYEETDGTAEILEKFYGDEGKCLTYDEYGLRFVGRGVLTEW